ncbi:hypothetical protein [Gimesia algae]|uniref:Uncharacterized protein n=1 Tax=Gimesia algae TaxID=2527971 RepID=A0A517VFG7_9PLAN|nr:hypothetical protein [Gimesia algae]QDT91760.1 hypothetical protein Pan161_34230 [Gimesia algae]
MESRAGAVCLEAVRSWLIGRISFGLRSDVAKKEIEFLEFEILVRKGVGKAGYTLCTPLSFITIEEFKIHLRQAEKLMQIEDRKNRRRKNM